MKVTIDLENMEDMLKATLEENAEIAVKSALQEAVERKVDQILRKEETKTVSEVIEGYIKDYLKTAKVHVGNSWRGEEVQEYTVEEYLKKTVTEIFDKKIITKKVKDRWGEETTENVSFEKYVKDSLDMGYEIEKRMKEFSESLKRQVNQKIRNTLDDGMRNALAENVFNIISATDTYRTINENLKLLGE